MGTYQTRNVVILSCIYIMQFDPNNSWAVSIGS